MCVHVCSSGWLLKLLWSCCWFLWNTPRPTHLSSSRPSTLWTPSKVTYTHYKNKPIHAYERWNTLAKLSQCLWKSIFNSQSLYLSPSWAMDVTVCVGDWNDREKLSSLMRFGYLEERKQQEEMTVNKLFLKLFKIYLTKLLILLAPALAVNKIW